MSSCPQCGTARKPGSEYCLECGRPFRAPTRPLRDRYAASVWPILAVLVLAALGALIAIAASRGHDGKQTIVATALPGRTTVPRAPVFGTVPTVTRATPTITTVAPPTTTTTTTAPKTKRLTTWTLTDGYTLVLASIPQANGRASAVQIAKRALAQGLSEVGILDSKDFAGLHPGYFVVFSGLYDSNAAAAAHIREARTAGFTSPYTRQVTR